MNLKEFNIEEEQINPFVEIGKRWFLITAGNKEGFNTMTASWGAMGVMWHKNCFTIVVRPQRKTLEFLDSNENFSICFFDEKDKDILKYCGANSGYNVDKIKETGLTPVFKDNTVVFEQAAKVLICKKLFVQKLEEESFVDKSLLSNYENNDYHYAIVGEIIEAEK